MCQTWIILLLVLIVLLVLSRQQERFDGEVFIPSAASYQIPYTHKDYQYKPYNCTDACVIRERNRGTFVDNECQKMCADEWTPQGYDQYVDHLQTSLRSGNSANMFGI
jgi:hypothetical protein